MSSHFVLRLCIPNGANDHKLCRAVQTAVMNARVANHLTGEKHSIFHAVDLWASMGVFPTDPRTHFPDVSHICRGIAAACGDVVDFEDTLPVTSDALLDPAAYVVDIPMLESPDICGAWFTRDQIIISIDVPLLTEKYSLDVGFRVSYTAPGLKASLAHHSITGVTPRLTLFKDRYCKVENDAITIVQTCGTTPFALVLHVFDDDPPELNSVEVLHQATVTYAPFTRVTIGVLGCDTYIVDVQAATPLDDDASGFFWIKCTFNGAVPVVVPTSTCIIRPCVRSPEGLWSLSRLTPCKYDDLYSIQVGLESEDF